MGNGIGNVGKGLTGVVGDLGIWGGRGVKHFM